MLDQSTLASITVKAHTCDFYGFTLKLPHPQAVNANFVFTLR